MKSIKQLTAERTQLFDASKALLAKAEKEERTLSPEERAEFDKNEKGMQALDQEIRDRTDDDVRRNNLQTRENEHGRPVPRQTGQGSIGGRPEVNDDTLSLAIQAWFRSNSRESEGTLALTDRHREACRIVGLNPRSEQLCLRLRPHEQLAELQDAFCSTVPAKAKAKALRAARQQSLTAGTMSTFATADGGAIMPPESMINSLEVATLQYGGILQAAQIMRTPGRERLRWPTVNDTSQKGRRIGESAAVAAGTNPVFGATYWDLWKYTSDEILVPYELLSGTPMSLPPILGEMMGIRIGRKASDDFTTGTGVNAPSGLIPKATSFAAPSATAIAWDDLESLITAVDPSYRVGASFMFHDNIRSALMKLKDGIGRPLWQASPNGEAPPDLKGYPWFINQSMDSTIASGKNTISFGRHDKYKVRQFDQIRIYRLIEQHRESDQDAFLAFMEMDGNLLDAGTHPVKYLAH